MTLRELIIDQVITELEGGFRDNVYSSREIERIASEIELDYVRYFDNQIASFVVDALDQFA
jgi:hypothetical protein